MIVCPRMKRAAQLRQVFSEESGSRPRGSFVNGRGRKTERDRCLPFPKRKKNGSNSLVIPLPSTFSSLAPPCHSAPGPPPVLFQPPQSLLARRLLRTTVSRGKTWSSATEIRLKLKQMQGVFCIEILSKHLTQSQ